MSDDKQEKKVLRPKVALWAVIGILGSIVAGLLAGRAGDYLIALFDSGKLQYEIVTSNTFVGSTGNRVIWALSIQNTGGKEIEAIAGNIKFSNATIIEHRVDGLPPSEYEAAFDDDEMQLHVLFLNPKEKLSIQLLLLVKSDALVPPRIDLRARGIIGLPRIADEEESSYDKIVKPIIVAASAIFAIFSVMRLSSGSRSPTLMALRAITDPSLSPQRDVLAFVLSRHGFGKLAQRLYTSPKHVSYLVSSDLIVAECLASSDLKLLKNGQATLIDLLEYEYIMESS